MTATWTDPVPVAEVPTPALDPIGLVLADHLRELIYTGATTSERSMQQEVGVSEVGSECERQLAYKIAGTAPVHLDENPMPSIIGTGFHLHVQRMIEKLDRRRYLVETPVNYKGIPGTVDLYDRRRRTVIDWKSTGKSKLRRLQADGPPMRAQVQIQIYGAALKALGEDPARLALAYVPRDGSLDDLWVWSTTPDQELVDRWINRFESITESVVAGTPAGNFHALPGPLCNYCPFYLPTSTDLSRGCPGPNL
jgi:hypothetical protein